MTQTPMIADGAAGHETIVWKMPPSTSASYFGATMIPGQEERRPAGASIRRGDSYVVTWLEPGPEVQGEDDSDEWEVVHDSCHGSRFFGYLTQIVIRRLLRS
jgi:hypothetical protein